VLLARVLVVLAALQVHFDAFLLQMLEHLCTDSLALLFMLLILFCFSCLHSAECFNVGRDAIKRQDGGDTPPLLLAIKHAIITGGMNAHVVKAGLQHEQLHAASQHETEAR
jgi:hypothetical protein